MKKYLLTLIAVATLSLGASSLFAQSAPKTVIHVVTVAWKAEAKPEQIQAALDGAKALPAQFPGIARVWTKTIKAQAEKSHVIAMEFVDEAALKAYADSPAQKEWYKTYLPIREKSASFDVTN